ncbi:hypothetical protein Poli38472_001321 [Pythium oligandrum]|uniref:Protein kinase domain-containing protein n=1 Tax=Pythium oligandrum TaxID=41045 RepID=A0A8K1FMB0_PYTOL|nr:hypothetical protein Poli38472_001321 [Pythium oligandrum]|eukprot:TMW69165.1 hypothetical protein Poli38472_001321 [Pythium oligandrum]
MVQHDHLAYRYEVLYPLGAGSFGQVICCRDHQTNTTVAVKVIRNRKKYKEQAVIEIQVLSQLQSEAGGQHSVIQMLDYFHFRNHLCITFELLGINLYDYLKLRYFQGLPLWNIQSISRQLLQALVHLRGKHIVHCDLKPENVLVRSPLEFFAAGPSRTSVAHVTKPIDSICLIDFGSSCLEYSPIYTYIQSRFYRSPEVILGYAYDTAIDMWSFGCILVELHTGHPLFAGESETEQLMCMMELLGEPSAQFLVGCKRRKQFFMEESAKNPPVATPGSIQVEPPSMPSFRAMPYTNSRGRKRIPGSRDVQKAIKSTDVEFVEVVLQCFTWDPRERLTPERALTMPWLLKQLSRES